MPTLSLSEKSPSHCLLPHKSPPYKLCLPKGLSKQSEYPNPPHDGGRIARSIPNTLHGRVFSTISRVFTLELYLSSFCFTTSLTFPLDVVVAPRRARLYSYTCTLNSADNNHHSRSTHFQLFRCRVNSVSSLSINCLNCHDKCDLYALLYITCLYFHAHKPFGLVRIARKAISSRTSTSFLPTQTLHFPPIASQQTVALALIISHPALNIHFAPRFSLSLFSPN
jgi:hypothetical protein